MSNVAKLRRFKGLTQSDMADILSISSQWYWKKEKGFTDFNNSEMIVLRDLFREDFPDISIDDIFFNEKVPEVEKE